MHGVTITQSPSDWEIIQHQNKFGKVFLSGTFSVFKPALEVGVEKARPMARVMHEEDNTCVIPWTEMSYEIFDEATFSGTCSIELTIPAGGLYRIETCLETQSTIPDLTWLYRGDCILHIGVGDLFLITGQSNSAGYSRDYAMDPPSIYVHLFRNRSRWDLASHPMNESTDASCLANEELGIPGVSPYLSFAKNLHQITQYPVGLIQTSLGGSEMKRWTPDSEDCYKGGDLYENMLDKINLTKGKYAGMLWYQGCSDTNPESAPIYFERFKSFVQSVRRVLGYELPIFTFQLNRQIDGLYDECWGMVKEAQRQAAKELPNVSILPTVNCPLCDGIHNNAHANVMLGEKLSRQCASILYKKPEFFAPEVSKVTLIDSDTLEITFDNMARGFFLFTANAADCGFTVEDCDGIVPIAKARANRQDANHIYLTLERTPKSEIELSFAWNANPTFIPPLDEVTFLPPLAFYKVKYHI